MTRRLKITAFALTLAGFGAMAGTYQLGFELWPPHGATDHGAFRDFFLAKLGAKRHLP
jgi:hypothetical protein